MYGASQMLHSNTSKILELLLNQTHGLHNGKIMIRFLFIKLFNAIDSSKQQLLFESIYKHLVVFDEEIDENSLVLGLEIIQDSIKLKFGSRLSHLSVIQLMESLNYLMTTKQKCLQRKLSLECKVVLASTLGNLFYFKNAALIQIYQSSQIDISTQRTIFTHNVYQLCASAPAPLKAYFGLFLTNPSEIASVPTGLRGLGADIDYSKILGLKANGNTTEFTADSHSAKLKVLIDSFDKHVQKILLSADGKTEDKMLAIGLCNQLAPLARITPQK